MLINRVLHLLLPSRSVTLYFVLAAMMPCMTSCMAPSQDYERLLVQAETNPAPDAIIGMWHRNGGWAGEEMWGGKVRQSYLFNRDGTGLDAYYQTNLLYGIFEQNTPFTWRYEGNGIWKTIGKKSAEGWKIRMSQGNLLLTRELNYDVTKTQILQKVSN